MPLIESLLPRAMVPLTDADECASCPVLREGIDILDGATVSYQLGNHIAHIVIPTWRHDPFFLGQEIDVIAPIYLRFQGKVRVVRVRIDLEADPPFYTQTLTLRG